MEWLGRAKIGYTHHSSPLTLKTKAGGETDLRKLVETSTPPCRLNPFIFNGHLQTMWTVNDLDGPPVYYRRKVFQAEQEAYIGSYAVDFAVAPHSAHDDLDNLPPRTAYYSKEQFDNIASEDTRPMVFILHGLSGGSYEVYLRHCIVALQDDKQQDWVCCVINSRGCAKSKVTSGVLFNARSTWDLRQTVSWARRIFPNRPLFAMGFSVGASIVTNYVAEEGPDCQLKAAIVVGTPFDLGHSQRSLQASWIGKYIYQKVMGQNCRELILNNKEVISKHNKSLDWDKLDKLTYQWEFDRETATKTWGYPTEGAYYRDASSIDMLYNIRIPFLSISAEDDPITGPDSIPYEEFKTNPNLMLMTTSLGGHLAYFELGGGRWHAKPISNFLRRMVADINLDAIDPKTTPKVKTGAEKVFTVKYNTNYDPDRRTMTGLSYEPSRRRMKVKLD